MRNCSRVRAGKAASHWDKVSKMIALEHRDGSREWPIVRPSLTR